MVLDGHGYRLLHESSAIGKVTKFLSTLPDFMDTISILHNAVTAGVVPVVQELLSSERLALSRDQYGTTSLHKAVLFYQPKIVKFIAEKYRITTRAKDQVSQSPPINNVDILFFLNLTLGGSHPTALRSGSS